MRYLHSIWTIFIGLLCLASFSAGAQSISLDSLPAASQDEISRICLPVQFREGAGAYRNCVEAELALKANGNTTELGTLSFDDKYAVQQACAKSGGQSSADYQSCVSTQVSALNKIAQPALDKLSEDELYVVQQSCFEAQSKQGAASYRQCLNGQVASLLAIPAADTSALNMLKKNALQLRCSSKTSDAAQYRSCIATEFESIAGAPPRFLPISTATTVANTTANNSNASTVNEPVTTLTEQAVPAVEPEPIAEAKPEPVTTPNQTAESTTQISDTELILAASGSIQESPASVTPSESVQLAANVATMDIGAATDASAEPESNTTSQARVISRPQLVETFQLQQQAKKQGIELDNAIEPNASVSPADALPAGSMHTLARYWQKFLDTLASLGGVGWLVLAGVLAMPALLLGLFSLSRRIKPAEPLAVHNTALTDRIEPGLQTRKLRHEQEAADLFGDQTPLATNAAQAADHDQITRLASKDQLQAAQHRAHAAAQAKAAQANPDADKSRAAAKASAAADAPATAGIEPHQGGAGDAPHNEHFAWQSAFGHWLMDQPENVRREACIEFLIYWVAYGDERYHPDLKTRLFTAQALSTQDQIKRWVLKQDVFAFADVVGWYRTHSTQVQRDQCLSLIMALLVTEHSVTPVQNTMLRFLSDAFDMGKQRLQLRFEKAFGHPLPPMPRTDSCTWWSKQNAEEMQRWDARSMSTKSEIEQMTARLGLTAGYDETQVMHAFRRASRRCHPDRFTELGEHERSLAEQQFIKFEQARDKLLGVSV